MNEGIKQRVARIVAGNVHALVDMAENGNPKAVAQQTIREIESAITEVRTELGREKVQLRNIVSRIKEDKAVHEALLQQIETAVREGRDDLAKAGIAKQMDIEAQYSVLEETKAQSEADIQKYQGYIDAMMARKREMEEGIVQGDISKKESNVSSEAGSTELRAENAYSRVMDSANVPKPEVSSDEAALEELAELDRQDRIRSRLAGLKNSVRQND